MKTKTHFIALLMPIALFMSCQSTRVQKNEMANALIQAAKNDDIAEARRLIADVNAKVKEGNEDWTVLMWAAWYNSHEVARLLLDAGADVDAKAKHDRTALMYAAQYYSASAARFLIAAGADLNARDDDGKTALMWAALWRSAKVAKVLIDAGADIEAKDGYGWTALMQTTFWNAVDVAKLLIAAGADVNATNNHGWTALMNAAAKKCRGGRKASARGRCGHQRQAR